MFNDLKQMIYFVDPKTQWCTVYSVIIAEMILELEGQFYQTHKDGHKTNLSILLSPCSESLHFTSL